MYVIPCLVRIYKAEIICRHTLKKKNLTELKLCSFLARINRLALEIVSPLLLASQPHEFLKLRMQYFHFAIFIILIPTRDPTPRLCKMRMKAIVKSFHTSAKIRLFKQWQLCICDWNFEQVINHS